MITTIIILEVILWLIGARWYTQRTNTANQILLRVIREEKDSYLDSWTESHQRALAKWFIVLSVIGVGIDLFLVLVLNVTSISMRTWIATETHPTLMAAGILLGITVCYLVRDEWRLVFFGALLTGHLFVHT